MGKTLFHKVWDRHAVEKLPDGSTQLFIGTHLIHEVTSPQAFGMLRDLGLKVAFPKRTFATVDHIVPTDQRVEPFKDTLADAMIKELRKTVRISVSLSSIYPQASRESSISSDLNRASPNLAPPSHAETPIPPPTAPSVLWHLESAQAKSATSLRHRRWLSPL